MIQTLTESLISSKCNCLHAWIHSGENGVPFLTYLTYLLLLLEQSKMCSKDAEETRLQVKTCPSQGKLPSCHHFLATKILLGSQNCPPAWVSGKSTLLHKGRGYILSLQLLAHCAFFSRWEALSQDCSSLNGGILFIE